MFDQAIKNDIRIGFLIGLAGHAAYKMRGSRDVLYH